MLKSCDQLINNSVLISIATIIFSSIGATSVLADEAQSLNEDTIIITATRTKVDLNDAPASVALVTSQDIELSASIDVLDAIRQTPGISFQGRGFGGRQALSIRGMGRDQTLFMIDGRRVLGTDNVFTHSNFQYNWMPINSIERIEVVRGPMSALYGSDALGGVVNLVTKPIPPVWRGSISARYSLAQREGDEQYIGLSAAGPLGKKASAMLSYAFSDLEEVPFAANPALSELEGKQAHNLYGRINLQPTPAHHFNFDLTVGKEDRFRNTNNRGRPPVFESSFDLDRLQYGAGYSGDYGKITAQVNYNHAELDRINQRTRGIRPSIPQTFKNDAVDGHIVIPAGSAHRFVLGGEYRRETLVHSAITGGKGSLDYTSAFAQDEWQLFDALRLTAGIRYDSHENFGSEFSPRAYMVYHFNENWTLKGGYGHGFKSPTLKQSLKDYRFIGPFSFVGNEKIGPETSDNFELNASYKKGHTRLAVTGFVNQLDNLITTLCIQNCTARFGRVFTFVNLERAETQGIETELEFDLARLLSLSVSHVYMKAKNKTTGQRLTERPKQILNTQLRWRLENPGLTAMVRASYHGNEIDNDVFGNVVNLPGYMLWYAQGAWDLDDRLQITFGVKNIGDLKLADKSQNFSFAERGRTFYIGVRRDL